MHTQTIVIVGGGFGGVRCAQRCAKLLPRDVRITLISDTPSMQYYAALYRALAGGNPLEACVPLRDLFPGRRVEVVVDAVTSVDPAAQYVSCASGDAYAYDRLILALGSQPSFFGIPGVEENAFTMHSVNDALRLKDHLHETLAVARDLPEGARASYANIVIIGAGATGVEVAGELAVYVRTIAAKHGVDPSAVTIDLVEALHRVLPQLPEQVSARVEERLQSLGVHLFLGRSVVAEDADSLTLRDVAFQSKTVIWTAGVTANVLYACIPGVSTDKRGRVIVDEHLRTKGVSHMFVIGDGASTPLSGMAQTALQDADHAAHTIACELQGKQPRPYHPCRPAYAVPIGPRWAVVSFGPLRLYGYLGWLLRRAADCKVFLLYLPLRKALRAFFTGGERLEKCARCVSYSDSFAGV